MDRAYGFRITDPGSILTLGITFFSSDIVDFGHFGLV